MKRTLGVVGAVAVLAGCGGSSTGTPTENPPMRMVDGSFAEFIDGDNNAALSTMGSYLIRDRNGDTVSIGPRQAVTAKATPRSNGTYSIEVSGLGHDVTLRPGNLNDAGDEYEIVLPDGETTVFFWTNGGTWQDALDGNSGYDFAITYGLSDFNSVQNVNNRVEGVIGLRTDVADLPTAAPVATYSGAMYGHSYLANDTDTKTKLIGDVSLEVAFAAGDISGALTDIRPENDSVGNGSALLLQATTLNNGQFTTTLEVETDGCRISCQATVTQSALNGAFYGPQADEAGGDFSVALTDPERPQGEQNIVINGSFIASQD